MSFFKKHSTLLILILSLVCYFFFAYFLERTQFYIVTFLWIALFSSFYLLLQNKNSSFNTLIIVAILFRCIFLFATPNLSQDFYRFIWDGRMLLNGFNPYLYLPETFIRGSFTETRRKRNTTWQKCTTRLCPEFSAHLLFAF